MQPALGRALPLGTGVPAGAKHDRPASRVLRGTTLISVGADPTQGARPHQILFHFAITFENAYIIKITRSQNTVLCESRIISDLNQ